MVLHLFRRLQVTFPLFFFNDTATPEIYPLSLHDALPISRAARAARRSRCGAAAWRRAARGRRPCCRAATARSEEHTSELQSRSDLVCRLLLEKKKKVCYKSTADHIRILCRVPRRVLLRTR